MTKTKDIPLSRMQKISETGLFIKRFCQSGKSLMKHDVHRDDYYIFVLLTEGSAGVEIDFERKELAPGDILIISPWQVHNKPSGEVWQGDGWMLALSPEFLSEADARAIEEYSIAPQPFNPGKDTIQDLIALYSMLERHKNSDSISNVLASAIKSFFVSTLGTSPNNISGRYISITLKLQRLLNLHLTTQKSPAAYASMLNITEVYLNEAVKGATGLSAGTYIRNRIIVQAKRKLAYTSMSAKEIAFSLGYEDYAHFSKLFKKSVGKSPVDFRKNLK